MARPRALGSPALDLRRYRARASRPRPYRPHRPDPRLVLVVSAGGALGAAARHGVGIWLSGTGEGFPWATLTANVTGSLLLGAVLTVLLDRARPSRHLRALLGTGFCGAYTTMSAFAVDTDLLVRAGHYETATAYVLASVGGGLAAVWAGRRVARLLPPRPPRRAHF